MTQPLAFVKMQGTGNDFVVLDGCRRVRRVTPALARRLCDRRFGVGADQLLVLEKSRRADVRMRIYNADGSQVEMCGNGLRCAARYARSRGLVKKTALTVDTLAGIKRAWIRGSRVRVDMGPPVLDAERIPTRARGRVIEHALPRSVRARGLFMTCLSMGNPHAVVFVDDVDRVPLDRWGPLIERDPFFPRRTNVEFAQVLTPDRVRVRVWERGSGATLACGTGACAVTVAGVLTGRCHRRMKVSLPGGDLWVEWAADDHVFLTGPAVFVYGGVITGGDYV